MIRLTLVLLPAFLWSAQAARADVYNFTYYNAADSSYQAAVAADSVYGKGTFTTGASLASGYVAITSISGTTEAGTILGLDTSQNYSPNYTTPPNVLYCCGFNFDNAYNPHSANPFSSTGGPLFDVSKGSDSPINLFGDGLGNTYEFSYGEDTVNFSIPSYGGTPIVFSASLASSPGVRTLGGTPVSATPEPGFCSVLAIGMIALTFFSRRRLMS